ncbi:metallophosphoesterase [Aerosakkonemataceae cyanobacterium BLCC-F50]|uniref:Metallophosphoesterase n=1 Tax=Floridaenema flaviceps BLCC-F50 TaxID=3153642 RepID=A0ABV4XL09_9CYAN
MNEIPHNWGLHSPSLTLYAFHLRNSINQGLEPTVPEAPRLWEQLVDLGNKLDIQELQNLPQQLISYQNNQYFPEAEDNQASEYCTLLRNRQASLDFQIIAPDGFPLQGLLCLYRLHDSYAIDLTLSSQERFFLSQLCKLNPQYLLLPSHIQASLGQTLLLFGQPIELQENYQGLADACVVQLLPKTDKSELINTGLLLGNPIFEYESRHKDPSKQLHILVWFKCQSMKPDDMDKASELLLYLLWCRHKIQYVYHESRWCDRQLKQLYNRIKQHCNSFSQISQSPERQRQFRQLLAELREIDIEYSGYLGDLDSHENTIAINEQNYRAKLEKLGALPETDLSAWQQFLDYVRSKLQRQIQADRRFLAPGRDRLQHLKAIVEESLTKDFENNDMPGIPAPLYKRLSEALSQCDQFENNQQLRSFFKGYDLLSPWANSLPQANSTAQRVTLVIGFLVEQYRNDTKENVLVILVRLLSQTIDPVDSRHQTLSEVADELNLFITRSGANPGLTDRNTGTPITINPHVSNPRVNPSNSFSWLHLTDFHQGMKDQDWLWPGVKEIFFEDLKRLHDKSGPWDLVVFTGDLTQRGSAEEFQKIEQLLIQLWNYFAQLGSSPKLLAVPGNHDLVRPNIKDPAVKLLRRWLEEPDVQEDFWHNAESPYCQVVAKAFENYMAWWERQPFKPQHLKVGILPGDFSATIEKNGAKLGILGLNTSFLQLTGENYEGKLAIHPRQFHQTCDGDGPAWARQHHACLLLTHHPPSWLTSDAQAHLNGEITARGRFAVHLCGHLHEANSTEIVQGGTEARRIWQGRSLCGLEYFETKAGQRLDRLHGYTAGKIELGENKGKLMFWPREARLQGGQRKIVPDYSFDLDDNQQTLSRDFELFQRYE